MKNTFSQNFSLVCCVFAANPRLENSGGCSHTCIDIFVGHICTCPHGFQIGDDARIYQGAVDQKLLRYILKIGILTLMLDFTTGMGSSRTVLNLEDSSRTKSRGLGLDLEEYIYLLSVVFTVAVRVTRTVQGSWFACLTLWSKLCEDRWLDVAPLWHLEDEKSLPWPWTLYSNTSLALADILFTFNFVHFAVFNLKTSRNWKIIF